MKIVLQVIVRFRYSQLMELMEFYTMEERFDADKYWNYGCNCMIHGDRPLSDMGTGPGVDRLDKKCREYKLCQQCARAQHGDMCIGEFVSYRRPRTTTILNELGVEETHKVCRDSPDTCERALCECDLQFAKDHAKVSVCVWKNIGATLDVWLRIVLLLHTLVNLCYWHKYD